MVASQRVAMQKGGNSLNSVRDRSVRQLNNGSLTPEALRLRRNGKQKVWKFPTTDEGRPGQRPRGRPSCLVPCSADLPIGASAGQETYLTTRVVAPPPDGPPRRPGLPSRSSGRAVGRP